MKESDSTRKKEMRGNLDEDIENRLKKMAKQEKKKYVINLMKIRLWTVIKTEKKDKCLKTKDERNHVFANVQMYSMVDP